MQHPTILKETVVLQKDGGDTITGDLRYPAAGFTPGNVAGIVVVCHSFMAFKDWGFFPHLAARIAESGFASFAFNFSWDGVLGSGNRITEMDRFRNNTLSKELDDCDRVVRAVGTGELRTRAGTVFNSLPLIFLGHSRGAGMSILSASRHLEINGLVTLAAVSTFHRWTDHQKSLWRAQGSLPLSRDTTASPMRLGIDLLNDLEAEPAKYDLSAAASRISVPWLLIHGTNDMMVKYSEAERLYAASDKSRTDLVPMDHAGHLFKGSTPTEDGYATLDHAIDIVIAWLHKHF